MWEGTTEGHEYWEAEYTGELSLETVTTILNILQILLLYITYCASLSTKIYILKGKDFCVLFHYYIPSTC